MAGNGTTIADLLSGNEAGQVAGVAEDTLEGGTAVDSLALADTAAVSETFYWNVAADPQLDRGSASVPDSASTGPDEPSSTTPPPAGDPAPTSPSLMPADAGGSGFDGMRIAIGDWNDPNWNGHGWVKILPAEGETPADMNGDGFDDAASGTDGSYEGGEYTYDGYYGGYYGDGSGDIGGDGFGDGGGESYDYAGYYDYSVVSAGDASYAGDGPGEFVIEPGEAAVFYAGGFSGKDINIELWGNAVLTWEGNEIFVAAGDSRVVFSVTDEVVSFVSGSPLLNSDVQITTTGIIGALTPPVYIADS